MRCTLFGGQLPGLCVRFFIWEMRWDDVMLQGMILARDAQMCIRYGRVQVMLTGRAACMNNPEHVMLSSCWYSGTRFRCKMSEAQNVKRVFLKNFSKLRLGS